MAFSPTGYLFARVEFPTPFCFNTLYNIRRDEKVRKKSVNVHKFL